MAITFVAEGTVANVASGNITLVEPAGLQVGDVLVACIAYRSNVAFTNPSGGEWTTIATQQSSGNTSTTASTAIASGHMAYTIYDGSSPNYTFTRTGGDVARGMVFAFRGVDQTTPIDNANSYTAPSNTSTPTVTAWTPSRENNMYVMFCAGADNVASSAWAANGGSGWSAWTEQEDSNTTSRADTNLAVAYATSSSTSAITSFQVTKAASSRHVLFAVGLNIAPPEVTIEVGALSLTGADRSVSIPEATETVNGVAYLMRDDFTNETDEDPLVDGNASLIGYRDVTGTQFRISDGRLDGGGSAATISYRKSSGGAGWSRQGGRTFTCIVSPWDGDLDDLFFHLSETAGAVDGYGLRIVGGSTIYAYEPDGVVVQLLRDLDNPIKATRYQLGITLNEGQGAVYWMAASYDQAINDSQEWDLVGPGQARILWVSTVGTADEFFPTIRNDGAIGPDNPIWEDLRLFDISSWAGADGMALVADRFNRADSTDDNASWDAVDGGGVWGISSNQAYLVSNSGGQAQASLDAGTDDNVILVVTQTFGSSSTGNSGIIMNRVSGTREINMAPYNDASVRIDSINGGYATLATGGPYLGTSDVVRWVAMRQGNQYRYWYNGDATDVIWPVTDSYQDSPGTYYGISTYNGPDTGVRWDNIAVYPLIITLPSEFTVSDARRPHLPAWTGATAGPDDTFTNTNGTALSTHDAQWSIQTGGYTIQSNRALGTAATQSIAYLDAGADDYSVEVDVFTMAGGTEIRAGLIVRRTDNNNYVVVRLFMDAAQPDNDEIEIEHWVGGSGSVFMKCYLNNYFALSTTYTLRVDVIDDHLTVYLDGVRQLDDYLPSALQTGQYVGLYKENVDDGCAHDNFTVTLDTVADPDPVVAEVGTLTLTASNFTVDAVPDAVTAEVGTLALTGANLSASSAPDAVAPTVGALSLTAADLSVSVEQPATIIESGSLSLSAADFSVAVEEPQVTIEVGNLALSGSDLSVEATPQVVSLESGSLAITVSDPSVSVAQPEVTTESGALGLTAANLSVSVEQPESTIESGSVALTGANPTVEANPPAIETEVGALSLTAADLLAEVTASGTEVTLGILTLTANDPSVEAVPDSIALESGSISLSASDFSVSVEQPSTAIESASLGIAAANLSVSVTGSGTAISESTLSLTASDLSVGVGQPELAIESGSIALVASDLSVQGANPEPEIEAGALNLAADDLSVEIVVTSQSEVGNLSLIAADLSVSVVQPSVTIESAVLGLTAADPFIVSNTAPIYSQSTFGQIVNNSNSLTKVVTQDDSFSQLIDIDSELTP